MDYVDVEYYLPSSWTAIDAEEWLFCIESASVCRERATGKQEVFSLAETSIVFPLRFHITIRARFL